MADPKNNVVPFNQRAQAQISSTPQERWAVASVFSKTADQHPRPIAVVYKALSFMLGENPMPDDLRMDIRESRHDSVILLGSFTVHPGSIKTTIRVSKPIDSVVVTNSLKVADLEREFHQLAPELTMYQVFSLKPARSLLGALLAFGAWLERVESDHNRKVFYFGVPTMDGWSPLVATIHMPYE